MRKKFVSLLLSASMLMSMALPAFAAEGDISEDSSERTMSDIADTEGSAGDPLQKAAEDVLADGDHAYVVYLGVQDYGTVKASDKVNFIHRFSVNGEVKTAKVSADNNYALQNVLAEGYVYDITVASGVVTAAEASSGTEGTAAVAGDSLTVDDSPIELAAGVQYFAINPKVGGAAVTETALAELDGKTVKVYGDPAEMVYQAFVAEPYTSPMQDKVTPGLKTIKNYLATALLPVGTGLYIYGGAWDWQDSNSSIQARTIGIPQTWIDFFQQQDADFSYKNSADPAQSYYPHNSWNQYYFAGPDCSGYVGWSVYNLLNTDDLQADQPYYVGSSSKRASALAAAGFGEATTEFTAADFKPGDVFSMSGHCWICLGTCPDGSLVILHSTPSDSRNGQSGGGVQISGVGNPGCQAYRLADFYMEKYFPEWDERYDAVCKDWSYLKPSSGKFSWNVAETEGEKNLTDPDQYLEKNAEEILMDLFGETESILDLEDGTYKNVVYQGIPNLGTFGTFDWDKDFTRWVEKPDMVHAFSINGRTETARISCGSDAENPDYTLQNLLAEGYVYDITVADGVVTAVAAAEGIEGTATVSNGTLTVTPMEKGAAAQSIAVDSSTKYFAIDSKAGGAAVTETTLAGLNGKTVKAYGAFNQGIADVVYQSFVAEPYEAPVTGTPGEKSLKNFLATAMMPVGTSLYIYGGTWNWEDDASSPQALTIGIPQTWIDFFQQQDINFSYKTSSDFTSSYYPHGGWNQYYFAGVDCSGYVGWSVYNTMNTESNQPDQPYYVGYASNRGAKLADAGFGTTTTTFTAADFKPGDIFCMGGHVWICLGVCPDGSLVILHSTPSDNKNGSGSGGGGVQLSGVGNNANCQAVRLADFYMEKYFPSWSERYNAVFKSYADYTNYGSGSGKFSWKIGEGGLTDAEGYLSKNAEEILMDLFGETESILDKDPVEPEKPAEPLADGSYSNAVYLGVQGYGTVNASDKDNFIHRFYVDGGVKTAKVSADNNYALQNILAEGYVYNVTAASGVVTAVSVSEGVEGTASAVSADSITVNGKTVSLSSGIKAYAIDSKAGGAVVSAIDLASVQGQTVKVYGDPATVVYQAFVAEPRTAPVQGTPGLRTIKNYLTTALQPVGTSLYIYGGTWDWQDEASSLQARTIGVPQTWIDFFQQQDINFSYKTSGDPAADYYPHNAWNQYYFAGVDCSGYVGWSVYNVMNTQSFQEDQPYYVKQARSRAQALADAGFGTVTQTFTAADFKPGDVMSMNGHCWICLGACPDGSLVILHSTPSDNKAGTGMGGGGVQISGVGDPGCQAYQLADYYMEKYFPEWSERYDAVCKDSSYLSMGARGSGKFSWTIGSAGLNDPDGYMDMNAEEILQDIFGEEHTILPSDPVSEEALADGTYRNVVYVGVQGYGTFACMNSSKFETIIPKEDMIHRFAVNGVNGTAKVSTGNNYALQNKLAEGYVYDITVSGGVVTAVTPAQGVEGTVSAVSTDSITVNGQSIPVNGNTKVFKIDQKTGGSTLKAISLSSLSGKTVKVYGNPAAVVYQTFVAEPYTPPVSGTPGQRTVKNYLATALAPVGTGLYVYGGTWDWQDVASSPQGLTIGVPQTWIDFFQRQNINYSYRDNNDYSATTYQHGLWNQYYYAGVDCSGYVGWSVYNVMNTQSFQEDTGYYVGGANTRAKVLAEAGFGQWTREFDPADFKPGDIMSMSGHCWICLGTCEDGSIVIAHSTPSANKAGTGMGGGGVQISGVSDKPNSQAYQLAKYYMEKYYPEWSSRYDAVQRGSSYYTNMSNANNGKFAWTIGEAGLTDPDGYRNKSAEEVLKDLFGENQTPPSGGSSSGGSSSSGTTTKNPDGSTTTTTVDKATGTVTETTKRPDGSQTVVKTQKDGTVTTIETDKAGNKSETVAKADGSSVTTVTQKDGTSATVTTDASGKVEAEVKLPATVVSEAQKNGETISLPIPEVQATRDTETAPSITVNTRSTEPTKVEIPAANPTPGTVAILVKADGTEEIIKTSLPTENGVTVELPDGATVKLVDNRKSFTDVSAQNWASGAIDFVSARELFSGTGEGSFSPEMPMTRAMLVTVLARFDGADTTGGATWYEKGVSWAIENGVSDGTNPNGNITREQLVTMLWRYAGSPSVSGDLTRFPDGGQTSGFAQEATIWAVENGIISGYGSGQLAPLDQATRAQVAQILKNFLER